MLFVKKQSYSREHKCECCRKPLNASYGLNVCKECIRTNNVNKPRRKRDRRGLESLVSCCYSCKHYHQDKVSRKCSCKLTGESHLDTFKCDKYEEIALIKCEICGIYVRNCLYHVMCHGFTKEMYVEFVEHDTSKLICSETMRKYNWRKNNE